MKKALTIAEVARLTDVEEIARECEAQERAQCKAASSSRIVYRETVDRNEARSDSFDDDASATMVGKAEAFIDALRTYCKAQGIKAHLAETVVALSACTRKPGYKYPYSMQELGSVLGCSHQSAQVRFETYLKHEAAVKLVAESVGLM